ncbi:hypothetical protein BGM09_11595 [Streptomyces sp. CBMA29]|nr:hypothetical protein [Streptomyces sp. CBMA29]
MSPVAEREARGEKTTAGRDQYSQARQPEMCSSASRLARSLARRAGPFQPHEQRATAKEPRSTIDV